MELDRKLHRFQKTTHVGCIYMEEWVLGKQCLWICLLNRNLHLLRFNSLPKLLVFQFFQITRSHFHDFMLGIHAMLKEQSNKQDPLAFVADMISAEARVLALDELFVTDVADAMIINRFVVILLSILMHSTDFSRLCGIMEWFSLPPPIENPTISISEVSNVISFYHSSTILR